MKSILEKLLAGQNLTRIEMWETFSAMMSGNLSESQIAAFLTALRAKGESLEEIATAAEILRENAETFEVQNKMLIDTCGTGGAKQKTFNVSTTVAFVLSAAGVTVAKHGNRSNTGRSGSSDLLQALGVNIQMSKEQTKQCLEETHFGFLFAPLYHPAMKYVAPVRKDIGIRTIFNLIGPLANPLKVKRQVLGVFDLSLVEEYAFVLQKLGHEKAITVFGDGGFDEFSLCGVSTYAILENNEITIHSIVPEDVGLKTVAFSELEGGTPEENAQITIAILKGKDLGPRADMVALNAAAGLLVAGKVSSLAEGVKMAQEILSSGKAFEVLEAVKLRGIN